MLEFLQPSRIMRYSKKLKRGGGGTTPPHPRGPGRPQALFYKAASFFRKTKRYCPLNHPRGWFVRVYTPGGTYIIIDQMNPFQTNTNHDLLIWCINKQSKGTKDRYIIIKGTKGGNDKETLKKNLPALYRFIIARMENCFKN